MQNDLTLCIMPYATEEQGKLRAIRVKVDPPVYGIETRHVSRGVLQHVGAAFLCLAMSGRSSNVNIDVLPFYARANPVD